MKKIIGALLALASSFALAATTVPVQLLNPTGSSSGQAIVSTGASSAPAWGGIGVNGIAAIAANTVLANATGSSAAPTAFAMPSCSATANVLQYTSGTGFTCLTTLFSSPTITTPNIVGTSTNNNAAAGSVGEYVTATGTAVALTTATPVNCTSMSLAAGDYDVWGNAAFLPAGGTTVTQSIVGINTTSATLPANPNNTLLAGVTFAVGNAPTLMPPPQRVLLAGTTTVYLVVQASFSGSTETATCFIAARRRR